MKNIKRVFSYVKHLWLMLTGYFTFSTISVIFSAFNLALLIPFLDILFGTVNTAEPLTEPDSKLSIDYILYFFKSNFLGIIQENGKESALIFICISIGTSVLLTNFFRYLSNLISAKMKADTLKAMRMDIFRKVANLHMGFFTNERKGDMIARMTNDVQEVEATILGSLKPLFQEPLKVIVYFIGLFMISFKLTLFTVLVLPVSGFLMAELIKRLKKQAVESQRSVGRIVNLFDELLGGIRVVKAFNAEKKVEKKMLAETEHYRKISFSMSMRREMASPISEFMGVGVVIVILYYGTMLILNGQGEMKPAEFMSYLAFFSQIITPAKAFSGGISNVQKGLASAERIFETLDIPSQVTDKENASELTHFGKGIRFRNVSFSYDKEAILHGIDFEIPKGKMVALVGPSGAGKSTIADLIPRFYDVTQGSIEIDGFDLRDITLASLRDKMGIVTQESILFNDTVFENIAFGRPNATLEQVMEAARIANAHEFIEKLENGYETMIGERGSRLSGGQRQRLSIARAVLKDPDILILDEATSALDSESEKLVQEALAHLMKNRTSIVIAHRLSTIRNADEIIVLESGRILERGSHEELVRKGGVYKKLSSMQNIFLDAEAENS